MQKNSDFDPCRIKYIFKSRYMLELRLEIVCHTPALQIYQPKQGDLEKQRYLSFYGGSCKW